METLENTKSPEVVIEILEDGKGLKKA